MSPRRGEFLLLTFLGAFVFASCWTTGEWPICSSGETRRESSTRSSGFWART